VVKKTESKEKQPKPIINQEESKTEPLAKVNPKPVEQKKEKTVEQKAPQEPKKEVKKKDKKKKEEEVIDEDAFLDSLIAQNKKCFFLINGKIACPGNVEVLGMICKFCERKFCTKHILAEVHGCGDKASHDAKTKFRLEFALNYNNDAFKPLRKDDEEMLKRKLAGKINKTVEERVAKPKKKDK